MNVEGKPKAPESIFQGLHYRKAANCDCVSAFTVRDNLVETRLMMVTETYGRIWITGVSFQYRFFKYVKYTVI